MNVRRIAPAVVMLIAAGVLLQSLASARHVSVQDDNDTKGKLDIREVVVLGKTSKPRWRITTFARWKPADLFNTGWFVVNIDTFGSSRFDYYALVRSNGRGLVGRLFKDRKRKRDRVVGKVPASHPDARSAALTVALRMTRRRDNRVYSWYVQTLFSSDSCRRLCIDRAPQRGRVTEPDGPGPEPEPTPTDTLPTP